MPASETVKRALKSTEQAAPVDSPIIAQTKGSDSDQPTIPDVLSVLPVRGMVVFPGTVVPLSIRRPRSLKMLDETLPKTKVSALLTQKDGQDQSPSPAGLYQIGVAGNDRRAAIGDHIGDPDRSTE